MSFATLAITRPFNFANENSRGDPFLIQTSVSGNILAGNRARALRKEKQNAWVKRTLPLAEEDMRKAKACEEMILYERAAVNNPSNATINVNQVHSPHSSNRQSGTTIPKETTLQEFENAVARLGSLRLRWQGGRVARC